MAGPKAFMYLPCFYGLRGLLFRTKDGKIRLIVRLGINLISFILGMSERFKT